MRFEARVFQLAKDPEDPADYQDSWRLDPARGIAAIADGVTSGIFSGPWAELLTRAVVADLPDPGDRQAFGRWLAGLREAWSRQVDVSQLSWFQKEKLKQGAFSTLLWVRLLPPELPGSQASETCRLHAFAIGDSCLFHVRRGEVLGTFPLQTAQQFEADPAAIGSMDLNRDQLLQFAALQQPCQSGDLLVLCTDAVAQWALRCRESGTPPDWEAYWQMTDQAWQQEIIQLRSQQQMRYDDATLVLLRVGEEEAR